MVVEWIDVNQEKPKSGECVLLFSKSGFVGEGSWIETKKHFFQWRWNSVLTDVLYWMPLPHRPFDVNLETWQIFDENKLCTVVIGNDAIVNVNEDGDVFFTLHPLKNKFVLNKVVGRDVELNMPTISDENKKEFFVYNNEDLKTILEKQKK
jgi:hypothetical protein